MTIEIKAMLWTMAFIVVCAVVTGLAYITNGWFIIALLFLLILVGVYFTILTIIKEFDNE